MLAPGQRIDRYEVEALVGQGGLAEVYRVRHTELGSVHALKILLFRKKSLDERLLLEGRIQAQLRHPNVVSVTDVVRHEGQVGLLMEYVDHVSLDELIDDRGFLPLQEALEVFAPVLAGVHAAHLAGVLHRDLKPANIMLARTPTGLVPKVADFGIAKVVDDDMIGGTREGTAMGTPGYMAPEQVLDARSVDVRTDVFALGAILYELLTGRRAFADAAGEVTVRSTLEGTFTPLTELVEGVPAHVDSAITAALSRQREDRFPTVLAFAEALYAEHPPLLAWVQGQGGSVGRALSLDPTRPSPYSDPGLIFGRGPTLAPMPGSASAPTYESGRVAEVSLTGQTTTDRRPPPFWLGVGIATGALVLAGLIGLLLAGPGLFLALPAQRGPGTAAVGTDGPGSVVVREGEPLTPATPAATVVAAPDDGSGEPAPGPKPTLRDRPSTSIASTPTAVAPTPTAPGTAEPEPPAPAPAPVIIEVEPPAAGVSTPKEPVEAPAPATAAPVMPMDLFLTTSWQGKIYKQLFYLRMVRQQGSDVVAEGRFLIGTNQRLVPLVGRFDPMSGTLLLRETNGDMVIQGRVEGNNLTGTYRREGKEGVEALLLSRR